MFDIPIIISAPDWQNSPESGDEGHSDSSAQGFTDSGPSIPGPNPSPAAHHTKPRTPSMVSEGTQTTPPGERTGKDSPTQFHSGSSSPKSPFAAWTEHLRNRHATPYSNRNAAATNIPPEALLAPPETDLPNRPMTPRADLYEGQIASNFGMTFGRPAPHWRRSNKPAACINNYEDHKHRMLMDWLERK